MKKLIALTLTLLTLNTCLANDDLLSEQVWQTLRKAKYTRTLKAKDQTERLPANTTSDDQAWFKKMEAELESGTEFNLEASFNEVDKLI